MYIKYDPYRKYRKQNLLGARAGARTTLDRRLGLGASATGLGAAARLGARVRRAAGAGTPAGARARTRAGRTGASTSAAATTTAASSTAIFDQMDAPAIQLSVIQLLDGRLHVRQRGKLNHAGVKEY